MAKSLQDRLKQRRSSTFVGREQQLELFRQNLTRSLDSEDYYFIFNIYGQGGVGKTELLRKYVEIAKEHKALTAYIDEGTRDIPEMLAEFARQLKEQKAPLDEFDERYKTYLQIKKRIEADPDAPKGTWILGARLLARGFKAVIKTSVSGSGLILDQIDADAVGEQVGEWAAFVKKKLTNKDEVQLLLEPIEVLTPLFLKGLGAYAKQPKICLFFDTYEETGRFADEWLRQLLEGKYGDAPEYLLITIAGRDELNPNDWSSYGGFLTALALEEFTEIEAKTYLERKNITNPATVETILHLSGRIPVWLATLAEAAPHGPDQVIDPSDAAIERFLKWIRDPLQQRLALHAALPRQLNQDIIQCLLPDDADAESLFKWLCSQPFLRKHKGGYWGYHSVVRDLMLRYQFQVSQETWSRLHTQLAAYYDKRAMALGIEGRDKCFKNDEFLSFALEAEYHRLSAAYSKELPNAIANFATVSRLEGFAYAIPWSESIYQAGAFWGNTLMGDLLRSGISAFLAEEWGKVLPMAARINRDFFIEVPEDAAFFFLVEANLRYLEKDFSNAIDYFMKAIEINPEDALPWYNIGFILDNLGQLQKAVEFYQKALEINPDNYAVWNNMGGTFYALGRENEAIKCLQKVIEINPEEVAPWLNMGLVLHNLGQLQKAVEFYQKGVEIKPDYDAAWYNMGVAYSDLGQKEKAVECYQEALKIKPDKDAAWYNMGVAYSDLGQKEKAVECYQKAVKIKPDKDAAWYNMGVAYSDLGQKEKAVECYQKAVKIKPDYDAAWYNMGNAYSDLGQKEKAVECYQKAIDLQPDNIVALNKMGGIYYALGQKEKAVECFQKAVGIGPDYEMLWNIMGLIYSDLGQKEKAVECYQKAVKIKPDYDAAWNNMGLAYSDLGQKEKAVECYQKAIEINPDYDAAWYNMGVAYSDLGQKEKAAECYQNALEINPDYDAAWYNMGVAYSDLGQKGKAVECYQKAIGINPKNVMAWGGTGWLHLLAHCLPETKEAFEKVWDLSNHQEPYSPMNLGHVSLLRGDQAQALTWYRQSLPLWEDPEEFFQGMEDDYKELNMAAHGIPRETYDAILQQLRSETPPANSQP